MPRFVILNHDHPVPHYDLMIETGAQLKSWRLPALLTLGCDLIAEAAPDHRRTYLDYQGPVSGGRGRVVRSDGGDYETLFWSENEIHLRVNGDQLRGLLHLRKQGQDRWLAHFEQPPPDTDAAAGPSGGSGG